MSITLDHLNIDLDGDGIPERYELGGSGGGGVAELPSNLVYFDEDGEDVTFSPIVDGMFEQTLLFDTLIESVGDYQLTDEIEKYDFAIVDTCWDGATADGGGNCQYIITKDRLNDKHLYSIYADRYFYLKMTGKSLSITGGINGSGLKKIRGFKIKKDFIGTVKPQHNYSTDEQIVGTWIDGKPVYEKTVILDNTVNLPANVVTTVGSMGVVPKRLLDLKVYNNILGLTFPNGIAFDNGVLRIFMAPGSSGNVTAFTFRYTKTTD